MNGSDTRLCKKRGGIYLLAVLCCVMWGSITPVVKLSYEFFRISPQDTPSLTVFAGVRYVLCGASGIVFGALQTGRLPKPRRSSWGKVAKLALVQTFVQQLAFYISLVHVSGVNASILGSLSNFFSILIACLVFRQERLTARKLMGCALGFAGVVCVNLFGGQALSGVSWAGEGALLVACISCGASYAMIKEYSAEEDVLTLTAYQFLLGGIGLCLAGLGMGGTMHGSSPGGYLLFSYMVLMPMTAFTIWGALLKTTCVSRLSVFGFINPIAGVLLSAVFLGESRTVPPLHCAAALLLVGLGIYAANSE